MSLLESYRKFYQATAERKERHHFKWSIKKTEQQPEESIYDGSIMSVGGALQGEATRFLAEGIEMWLNPPKEFVRITNYNVPGWWPKWGW